jgi:hypothetical protein
LIAQNHAVFRDKNEEFNRLIATDDTRAASVIMAAMQEAPNKYRDYNPELRRGFIPIQLSHHSQIAEPQILNQKPFTRCRRRRVESKSTRHREAEFQEIFRWTAPCLTPGIAQNIHKGISHLIRTIADSVATKCWKAVHRESNTPTAQMIFLGAINFQNQNPRDRRTRGEATMPIYKS